MSVPYVVYNCSCHTYILPPGTLPYQGSFGHPLHFFTVLVLPPDFVCDFITVIQPMDSMVCSHPKDPLSSINFSLPHSTHLQPGPGLCLDFKRFSWVVSMCSSKVTLTLARSGPRFWLWVSRPVPGFLLELILDIVLARLSVIDVVEPIY